MVWFDLITGSSSTLEFDINSSLEGEFEVQFDIDQLAFHTKQGLTGSPFTLENVKISGDFDATLSARAGARLTVSVNGQPVHLDAALALRLLLKIQPDVDFRQEPVRFCPRWLVLSLTSVLQTHAPCHIAAHQTRFQTVFERERRVHERPRTESFDGKPGQYCRQD